MNADYYLTTKPISYVKHSSCEDLIDIEEQSEGGLPPSITLQEEYFKQLCQERDDPGVKRPNRSIMGSRLVLPSSFTSGTAQEDSQEE